jgi:hypothetical protein
MFHLVHGGSYLVCTVVSPSCNGLGFSSRQMVEVMEAAVSLFVVCMRLFHFDITYTKPEFKCPFALRSALVQHSPHSNIESQ